MQWVDDGLLKGHVFYIASFKTGNMIQTEGKYMGELSIFARELDRIKKYGYVEIGNYLVPPNLVSNFR